MRYSCTNLRRLQAVKLAGALNGIVYLEVRDTEEPVRELRQRTLFVRLLLPVPATLTVQNVDISGGERIGTVAVQWAAAATQLPATLPAVEKTALLTGLEQPDHVLVVRTAVRGDFSWYSFRLSAGPGSSSAPADFDPLLNGVRFSFKIECPGGFDCSPGCGCLPEPHTAPEIDYLAKDYLGFRRIMLDRMALLSPQWTGRNPADVGIALVELLAYAADELSYRQDAVTTEAYLDTARSRISLRRHARLVDYRVHEGCNARAWVQIRVDAPKVILPAGTTLLSEVPGLNPLIKPNSPQHADALAAGPVVFETVDAEVLHEDLNELRFYTWGEQGCCLPRGADAATLRGRHPELRAGDVLVLTETLSPTTGEPDDADPSRRWPVRLVDVRTAIDPSGKLFPDGTTDVTEIRWRTEDRLPFPLCLSVADGDLETALALGNVVLADHGQTLAPDEDLGTVPRPRLARVQATGCDDDTAGPLEVPVRFRPSLRRRPLTRTVAHPPTPLFTLAAGPALLAELTALTFGPGLEAVFSGHGLPLAGATVRGAAPRWSVSDGAAQFQLRHDAALLLVYGAPPPAAESTGVMPRAALPALSLTSRFNGAVETWTPLFDLLGSRRSAPEFAVETEHDGTVRLRFGDGEHGLRPVTGTGFLARYRIGNGTAGNVGRGAITHAVTAVTGITGVDNPLPAAGGADPESADEIRRDAPHAFAVQERAVTEADYTEIAQRSGTVQRAAASFRWTGSWRTVFLTADRFGGSPVDEGFEKELRRWLEKYRMAGYDLEVDAPQFIPLEIGLHVCVSPGHFRSDVAAAVRAVLSDGTLPDGRRGLFHSDNLTFGQPVFLSGTLAAVHSVPGVQSVDVRTFERQRQPGSSGVESGVLRMGRLEIARLDNDPNFPEHGVLNLTFGGGI
jgi:hypothetical protein